MRTREIIERKHSLPSLPRSRSSSRHAGALRDGKERYVLSAIELITLTTGEIIP